MFYYVCDSVQCLNPKRVLISGCHAKVLYFITWRRGEVGGDYRERKMIRKKRVISGRSGRGCSCERKRWYGVLTIFCTLLVRCWIELLLNHFMCTGFDENMCISPPTCKYNHLIFVYTEWKIIPCTFLLSLLKIYLLKFSFSR